MPVYEYEHLEQGCDLGNVFEVTQSMTAAPLRECPRCGQAIKKLISVASISLPKTNTELRDKGFTKLVRRDDGVYENVTARSGERRYMMRGRSETLPDIKRIISD